MGVLLPAAPLGCGGEGGDVGGGDVGDGSEGGESGLSGDEAGDVSQTETHAVVPAMGRPQLLQPFVPSLHSVHASQNPEKPKSKLQNAPPPQSATAQLPICVSPEPLSPKEDCSSRRSPTTDGEPCGAGVGMGAGGTISGVAAASSAADDRTPPSATCAPALGWSAAADAMHADSARAAIAQLPRSARSASDCGRRRP